MEKLEKMEMEKLLDILKFSNNFFQTKMKSFFMFLLYYFNLINQNKVFKFLLYFLKIEINRYDYNYTLI